MKLHHTTRGPRRATALLVAAAAVLASLAAPGDLNPAPETFARAPQQARSEVRFPTRSDRSPRLPNIPLPPVSLAPGRIVKPIRLNPNRTVSLALQADGALQSSFAVPLRTGQIRVNVDGIGRDFVGPAGGPGFNVANAPPDTSGAVGETQFVQWVNSAFAVFDKKTGKAVFGPVPGNTLWQGLGGNNPTPCERNNDGDPIVQYDKAARRWMLSQFSVSNGDFAQCIAVSTTPDALGEYFRYEFKQPAFNDYPKVGVWPDGYYISYNMFDGLSGARACAYERVKMLAGDPKAMEQCFQLSRDFFGLLPSDLDGPTAPPPGSPNYFVGLGLAPNTISLWKFRVDWANPNNTTFGTGPNTLPDSTLAVARFNFACGGTGATCVPQRGTSQQLDSLGERLMFRLAYRNMGSHQSLLVNHSVDTGPPNARTGVRWYEIRDPNGAPRIFQQGTYAPDGEHRWMGGIGMDRRGNIVLGYSVSGSVHPSIRLASRLPTDPGGKLGRETVIHAGTGSQVGPPASSGGPLTRWGDYTGLSIDPLDDCTFWYTTQYIKDNDSFNWRTRIASFKLDKCS